MWLILNINSPAESCARLGFLHLGPWEVECCSILKPCRKFSTGCTEDDLGSFTLLLFHSWGRMV